MNFNVGQSETIECVINNITDSRYRFVDLNNVLDDAIIHAITVHSDTMNLSPRGKTLLYYGQMRSCFLTLAGYKNQQFNKQLPFTFFIQNDSPIIYIKPKMINLRNSYVEIADRSTLGIGPNGSAIVFTFYYEKYDPQKHKLNDMDELIED